MSKNSKAKFCDPTHGEDDYKTKTRVQLREFVLSLPQEQQKNMNKYVDKIVQDDLVKLDIKYKELKVVEKKPIKVRREILAEKLTSLASDETKEMSETVDYLVSQFSKEYSRSTFSIMARQSMVVDLNTTGR